ncbi:MAG: (d)CMP kinase [Candidatus Binatia bacterium]
MFALGVETGDSRATRDADLIIAIDGPSGAGKSTLAKKLAEQLGFIYLDTGAMYRALALKILRQGVDLADDQKLAELVNTTAVDLQCDRAELKVLLDEKNVASEIRTPAVSQMASKASALKIVRDRMLDLQRRLGQRGSVVAEGRDIGTVVFPDAEVKIFLSASAAERARRRCAELRAAGQPVDLDVTLREIEERDKRDSERALAPLQQAQDALVIDSSNSTADEVAARVLAEIRMKQNEI